MSQEHVHPTQATSHFPSPPHSSSQPSPSLKGISWAQVASFHASLDVVVTKELPVARTVEIQALEDELVSLSAELERTKSEVKERQQVIWELNDTSSKLAEREQTIRSREYELDFKWIPEVAWCDEFLALTKHIAAGGTVEDISSVIEVHDWYMPGW